MPDFIAQNTLETLATLTHDLEQATIELANALNGLQGSSNQDLAAITPQAFVERVLALDEQISRSRLLLPLCTTGVLVNEAGRTLTLSDLLGETRSEFDSLARAQLEARLLGRARLTQTAFISREIRAKHAGKDLSNRALLELGLV